MKDFLSPNRTLIVADGEKPSLQVLLHLARSASTVIALDGAISWLLHNGVTPNLVIGDLDSALPSHLSASPTLRMTDQDTNDLEKALNYCCEHQLTDISILGGFGQRADHFLTNLYAMRKHKDRLHINMIDDRQCVFFCPTDSAIAIEIDMGAFISLFPLGNAGPITTSGVQYPLKNEYLYLSSRIGTLNRVTAPPAMVRCMDGDLLILCDNAHRFKTS